MNLNDVHRGIEKHKKRKRVGRGIGSGHGKTSGRGHKGQGARAGWTSLAVFEGGQMPLVRRVPKRGFHNRWGQLVAVINLGDLDAAFAEGAEVNSETLRATKLLKGRYDELKVLGDGALTKRLKISAHRFSRSALEKIQQVGGEAVVLPGKTPPVRNKQRKRLK